MTEKAGMDISTFNEEVKDRLRQAGKRPSYRKLERIEAVILSMAGKGRPVRPLEVREDVRQGPSFSHIRDAKREVMRVLELLKEVKVVENRKGGCYSLTLPIALPEDLYTRPNLPKYVPEKVKPVVQVWNRVYRLRALLRAHDLSSLGHAIFYELMGLRTILESIKTDSSRERVELISEMGKRIESLTGIYIAYGRTGAMPEREPDEFRALEEGIEGLYRTLR